MRQRCGGCPRGNQVDPIFGSSNNGTVFTAGYNPYTGGTVTVATGAAAAPAVGGIMYSPVVWLVLIIGAIIIARR